MGEPPGPTWTQAGLAGDATETQLSRQESGQSAKNERGAARVTAQEMQAVCVCARLALLCQPEHRMRCSPTFEMSAARTAGQFHVESASKFRFSTGCILDWEMSGVCRHERAKRVVAGVPLVASSFDV